MLGNSTLGDAPLGDYGGTRETILGTVTLPAWVASGTIQRDVASIINGSVVLPVWAADGEVIRNGISGTVTMPQWTAYGWMGVRGQPELPEWTAVGTVTTPGWVTGSVKFPAWTARGILQTGAIARASVTLPLWTAEGHTGVVAEVTLPVWTVNGTISNFAQISGIAAMSRWLGSGAITTGSIVSGVVTLSAWTATGDILNGSWVTGVVSFPAWKASGYLDSAITETTYAINLSSGAVTQLLLGVFDKLVTAHGRLYGLKGGTLIYLGGDTDQGVEIPATIRFAPYQFGTHLVKRIDGHVYLNMREDDGVTLTLVQDETTAHRYQSITDKAPAMGTHRVRVGRGVAFHSIGFILENRNGGRLDIKSMEIPVLLLSRKIR